MQPIHIGWDFHFTGGDNQITGSSIGGQPGNRIQSPTCLNLYTKLHILPHINTGKQLTSTTEVTLS